MTILQDLEAARDALAGVKAMLPSDVPELPDTERISGSFIYLRWQELREVKAALSRLSTLIEQVRGQEPVAWMCTRQTEGKKVVFSEPCVTANPAYVKAHPGHDWTPLYTSPTPAAAPEFDSAPQVSRNPQTGIKPAAPAVDVERLIDRYTSAVLELAQRSQSSTREQRQQQEHDVSIYRAALRMHLTGGKQ